MPRLFSAFADGIDSRALTLSLMSLMLFGTIPSLEAAESGWGTVRGQIIVVGDVPAPEPLEIVRDSEVCGQFGLTDQSLLVNPENRGLQNVAVWLETREKLQIHPEYQERAGKPAVLDNRDCRFQPHLLALQTGQTLHIRNSDPVAHNAAVYVQRNQPFSMLIPANDPLEKQFSRPETQPVRVDCSIHAWMKAWLLILDHPYVAITDQAGTFEIRNIPAGTWKFRFWQERSKFLKELQQSESDLPLDKGAWTITVEPGGMHDLGPLRAPVQQFVSGKNAR